MRARPLIVGIGLLVLTAAQLNAQSSAAACAPSSDSAAHQVVKDFEDLRVCLLAFGGDSAEGPRGWATGARRIVLETQRGNDRRRLMVAGDVVEWAINGQAKPVDSASQAWRVQVIELLAPAWEATELRASAQRLQTDIDSLPVRRARIQAQLDTLNARTKRLGTALQNLRTQDRTLRSQVTTAQGRVNSLNGQISREEPKLNSSDAAVRTRAQETIRRLEEQVRREEDNLRSAERRQRELDAERRIDALEADLAALRPEHTAAMLKLQLNELDPSVVPALKQDLAGLDAENRLRALDAQVAAALARLRATLGS